MVRLYLAHPKATMHKMRKWVGEFKEKCGIDIINPFDLQSDIIEQIEAKIVEIETGDNTDYTTLTLDEARKIVLRDLRLIDKCTGIIAIVDGSYSIGTIMEIFYASSQNKPVYIMTTDGSESHPWVRYCATEIYTSLEELEGGLIKCHT